MSRTNVADLRSTVDSVDYGAGIYGGGDLNDATTLDLHYEGEVGTRSQTHAVTGTWTRF